MAFWTSKIALVAILAAVALGTVVFVDTERLALAQAVTPTVRVDKQMYVAGVDPGIEFSGSTSPTCANSTVTLALYLRGPASAANATLNMPKPVSVTVGADGSVKGSIALDPSTIRPMTVWAAVSGRCLEKPVFAETTIQLAVRDAVNNPDSTSSIFIPASVLSASANIASGGTLGAAVGSLTVFADGVECVKASLTAGAALDGEGNARISIGGASQAAQCSRQGAQLTFARADGALLFETRALIPGVTQPLANLAPQAPGSGSSPGAPSTGAGAVEQFEGRRSTRLSPWRLVAFALGAAGLAGTTWHLARRRYEVRH